MKCGIVVSLRSNYGRVFEDDDQTLAAYPDHQCNMPAAISPVTASIAGHIFRAQSETGVFESNLKTVAF